MTPVAVSVAVAFAQALVAGDFEAAHAMLASDLAGTLSARSLESKYREMTGWLDEPATDAQVVTTLEEWPDKQPGDLGWVYAAIWGSSGSEAVTVVVKDEAGRPAIRSIEWGRP